MRRFLAGVLSAAMIASVLIGCTNGNKNNETDSGTKDSIETKATEQDNTEKDVVISMMSWHGESSETKYYDGLKMVMDEYTAAHPNVTFDYIQQPLDGYMDLLDTQFISGGAPDLVYMQPHMSRAFADKGVLLALDEFMYSESPYAPGKQWVETFSGGEASFSKSKASNAMGAIMFVPMDSSAVLSMGQPFFYNKDLFEEAGITELPTTFVEFLAALQQLKDAGINPVAGEFTDRHVSWSLGWISDQFGEHYIDQYFDDKYNGSDLVDLKEDKTRIALANDWFKADDQIFVDISNALKEYSDYWQDGWTGCSYTEARNLFLMQEAAIFQEGFWAFSEYQDVITDFEWGVLAIPVVTKETSSYAMEGFMKPSGQQDSGFNLNANLQDDPEKLAVIIDFLQYLTSQDVQQRYVDLAVSLSPVEGVTQPEEMQPFLFETDLCIYEQSVGSYYVDFGDSGIWGGLTQEYLTGKTDTATFNEKAIANAKATVTNDIKDIMLALPENLAAAQATLDDLKATGANEALIKAQESTVKLLELKLEMYQTYCPDL